MALQPDIAARAGAENAKIAAAVAEDSMVLVVE
jgi:hypothetical protein